MGAARSRNLLFHRQYPWLRDLLSFAQQGCDHSGTAPAVEDSNDQERFFVGRVSNQEISHWMKAQRSRSKIGTCVTLVREANEGADRVMDFPKNAVRSVLIVRSDVFLNLVEVCVCVRVEDEIGHEPRRSSLLRRRRAKACSPSTGSTRPLLMSS
jgi:hypothetical protein